MHFIRGKKKREREREKSAVLKSNNIRLLIFTKYSKLIGINKTVALFGVSTKEIKDTEIRKQVNRNS